MKHLMLCVIAVGCTVVFGGNGSDAGTVTTTLPVHVTVAPQCGISTNGIEFGVWTHQELVGKGTININCHHGIEYRVSLGAGAHYDSGIQARQLSGPDSNRTLSYRLYQDASLAIEWGDRGLTNSYPIGTSLRGVGTSTVQPLTVYGKIPRSDHRLPPGSYSDTVLVTVQF